jgi:hypothetical protein
MKARPHHFRPRGIGGPILEVNAIEADDERVPILSQQAMDEDRTQGTIVQHEERLLYPFLVRWKRRGQYRDIAILKSILFGMSGLRPHIPGHLLQTQNRPDPASFESLKIGPCSGLVALENARRDFDDGELFGVAGASGADQGPKKGQAQSRWCFQPKQNSASRLRRLPVPGGVFCVRHSRPASSRRQESTPAEHTGQAGQPRHTWSATEVHDLGWFRTSLDGVVDKVMDDDPGEWCGGALSRPPKKDAPLPNYA